MPHFRLRQRVPNPQNTIAALLQQLAMYHALHEREYGPMDTCEEVDCVKGRWALEWLRERAAKP